jgi:hypothetical protein
LAPDETIELTCDVVSPLGGSQMLILPELYVPGNGCIVADSAPRVVMVGNNFGVNTTLRNRCGTTYSASEGGLGWVLLEIGTSLATPITIDGATGGTLDTCSGPSTSLSPGGTVPLTCDVSSPLGGSQMLTLPEMYVPGNGCIVSTVKPQTVLVGNNFGVATTLTNRCATSFSQSEGGLGWLIWELAP